jgi:hypothetical protein
MMGDAAPGDKRPAKRRKTAVSNQFLTSRPEVSLKLTTEDATTFGLKRREFIEVDKLEYVKFNSEKGEYLYALCSALFEVPTEELTLLYTKDGRFLDDDDDSWEVVEADDEILGGDYLLLFEHISGTVLLLTLC